jgi:hypothetical protein
MRRPLLGAVFLAVAITLLSAGCAVPRPRAPRTAPAVLPAAAELEAALRARTEAIHSLRALARLRSDGPEESTASREALVVARPDRLRVEVLSLFGSVFVLTADNGQFTAYARQEDTVYRGVASPQNLWRYARLGLPVSDVVAILLGTPPLRPGRRDNVTFDADAGAVRLVRQLDDGTQIVWFSETTLPVAAEQRSDEPQAQWRATFSDYEEHGGVPVATHIGLEWPAGQRSLEITLGDIDLNPTLAPSAFALEVPPGSKVVRLDPAPL